MPIHPSSLSIFSSVFEQLHETWALMEDKAADGTCRRNELMPNIIRLNDPQVYIVSFSF
jgi:hypothetical protein